MEENTSKQGKTNNEDEGYSRELYALGGCK